MDFSSSRLVRLLNDWAPGKAQAPRQDFAQRLGQWLGVSDAITLHAAHQSSQKLATVHAPVGRVGATKALKEEFDRVRTTLVKAIAHSGTHAPARNQRDRGLRTLTQTAPGSDVGFAPYQQRYLDQQRQMALRIEALRGHVRHALTLASPRLAQLAAMDAVLEQMFGARGQCLLGTVPDLLERRFEQLRAARQLELNAKQQPDDPVLWHQPGGWRHAFDKELEDALIAELEVRLEPVTGLMEALNNELEKYA